MAPVPAWRWRGRGDAIVVNVAHNAVVHFRRGDGLVVALQVIQPQRAASSCECTFGKCRFRPALVRFYLAAYRQARILREDPSDVLRDNCRNSREEDPWIKGGRIDREACRDLMLSLQVASQRTGIELTMWNANRLAEALCPMRWNED